jgi:hypothetical protein
MKAAKSPNTERIKPHDHIIVGVGSLFVRANFEEVLVPDHSNFTPENARWVSRYRLDKPTKADRKDQLENIIHLEKDPVRRTHSWADGNRRLAYKDGSKLHVPHIFADEHFVAGAVGLLTLDQRMGPPEPFFYQSKS